MRAHRRRFTFGGMCTYGGDTEPNAVCMRVGYVQIVRERQRAAPTHSCTQHTGRYTHTHSHATRYEFNAVICVCVYVRVDSAISWIFIVCVCVRVSEVVSVRMQCVSASSVGYHNSILSTFDRARRWKKTMLPVGRCVGRSISVRRCACPCPCASARRYRDRVMPFSLFFFARFTSSHLKWKFQCIRDALR